MKKSFLTFVLSYLLLAVFIGSAEAKKMLAADQGPRFLAGGIDTEWAPGEPDGSMEWLLSLYGIKDGSDLITVENSANSTDEDLPASEEYEEDFSLGEELLFGYNLAGLVYGDRFLNQTAYTPIATDQTTVSGSTHEKVPVVRYETTPFGYFDPPTIVHLKDRTRPASDPGKPPVSPYKPEGISPPPDVIPPQVFIPRKKPYAELPSSEKPGYNPEPGPNAVNSPAPVPEPATMLLFSTGIAGIAFSGLRRNRNADKQKKG